MCNGAVRELSPHCRSEGGEEMSIFPTTILLATDGSGEAELAARTAADLANSTNSELHVLTVAPGNPDPIYHVHEASSRYETYEEALEAVKGEAQDRKSTSLNSSHAHISYAVFCLKKKIHHHYNTPELLYQLLSSVAATLFDTIVSPEVAAQYELFYVGEIVNETLSLRPVAPLYCK